MFFGSEIKQTVNQRCPAPLSSVLASQHPSFPLRYPDPQARRGQTFEIPLVERQDLRRSGVDCGGDDLSVIGAAPGNTFLRKMAKKCPMFIIGKADDVRLIKERSPEDGHGILWR